MAKMTVYHGGFMPVEHPEIRIGKEYERFRNRILLYNYKRAGTTVGETI